MDINSLYNEILTKYDLVSQENGYEFLGNYLEKSIIEKWNSIDKNFNIAIWGAGEHTEKLLEIVDINKKKVKCLIDKNSALQGKMISNIEIVSVDMLPQYEIDAVVISSPKYAKEIKLELETLNYNYIDLYESISEFNVGNFPWYIWKRFDGDYQQNSYLSIFLYLMKKIYIKEQDKEIKENILQAIIKKYLSIYDIVNAKHFIEIYRENGYNRQKYDEFIKEIDAFFESIRLHLKNRNKEDIIITISDALRYKEIDDIRKYDNKYEYLHKISNESLFFKKAIANSTYTKAALHAMLSGELINFNDKYINCSYILNHKESRFISKIIEKGYYVINESITRLVPDNIKIKNLRIDTDYYECCSVQLWRMLTYLCGIDDKVMYILHFNETHHPYNCEYYEKCKIINVTQREIYKEKIDLKEQYLECIMYLDKQLGFYMNMLSDNAYKIITSDHGQCLGEHNAYTHTLTWYDEVLRTPLIINGNGVETEIIEDLFDKKDFGKLILGIIDKSDIIKDNSLKVKYVKSARDALYSPDYLNDKKFIEALGSKFMKGYIVITTDYQKYVRYEDGVEELYLLDDEDNNIKDRAYILEQFRNI